VNAVAACEGRLATLAGEPGVGKTRLAQDAMLLCREQGFVVATGRCYEPHQAVPYYPFLEALSVLYAAAPEAVRAEASVHWPTLLRLLPDQPSPASPESPSSPQEEQQRLFWAVTGFTQAVSETAPLALLLDDLHWVDDASLALLQSEENRHESPEPDEPSTTATLRLRYLCRYMLLRHDERPFCDACGDCHFQRPHSAVV
jgi:predicted ATPase